MTAPHPGDTLRARPRQYLVTRQDALDLQGLVPVDDGLLLRILTTDPTVEVVRTRPARINPFRSVVPGQPEVDAPGSGDVVIATMSVETAGMLAQHPQVLVEEDELLRPVLQYLPPGVDSDPSVFNPFGVQTSWSITVVGPAGEPVVGAAVYVYGQGAPVQGTTDATGTTHVVLNGESETVRSIYVNPRADYWNIWLDDPDLVAGQANRLVVQPLSTRLPGFPAQQTLGWGQQLMRLDLLPAGYDGAGVQIAVIDSGAAPTHRDLKHVTRGSDFTVTPAADTGWEHDLIAHGSHCSGVIAGIDQASGIRGFAPAATVHALRVFPGGRLSSLLDALDYCLDNDIDVVNMSLGGGGASSIALAKLAECRAAGIVCVVAAGNTAGPVSFPGTSPDVLTVAAMGKTGEYPDDSYHARLPWTGGPIADGLFSAQFSCHGPEVDVCAPGVAVVSSVPDDGFASWDGTSMAAPHVAGLAALVLAHHPDLQGAPRTAARVDLVRSAILSSAAPLDVGDVQRTGAGVPDAPRALGLGSDRPAPGPGQPASGQQDAVAALVQRVRAKLVLAGLS